MGAQKDELVLESLRSVIDPEIGLNIVELGLIREIEINDEEETADITMILTTPFSPYGPSLIVRVAGNEVMRGGVAVQVGTEMWDPSMMEEGAGGEWGLF